MSSPADPGRPWQVARWGIVALVALVGVSTRVIGVGRSIWLDEAWVANSIQADTLTGMFFYEPWLQTSPPLFLLLSRAAVTAFGGAEPAIRLVSLVGGVVALAGAYFAFRRVLPANWALLAWMMVALSPQAIDYAKEVKQYSLELALDTLMLWGAFNYMVEPTRARYVALLVLTLFGVAAGYATVFLVPGLALALVLAADGRERWRPTTWESARVGAFRAGLLAALVGIVAAGLYVSLVMPNAPPALREFWFDKERGVLGRLGAGAYDLVRQLPIPDAVLSHTVPVSVAIVVLLMAGTWLAWRARSDGRPPALALMLVSGTPLLAAVVANAIGVYPVSTRTSLFLLPGTALVVTLATRQVAVAIASATASRWVEVAVGVMTLALPGAIAAHQASKPAAIYRRPVEDFSSAVAQLQARLEPGDTVWVHASAAEPFKYYTRLRHWSPPAVIQGMSGWPCCPRGISAPRGGARPAAARRHLDGEVPGEYAGRLWLLFTARAEHWQFVGVDESAILEELLAERGCRAGEAPAFENVGLRRYDCPGRGATAARGR